MNTVVAIIVSIVVGFALSALLGIVLVPWLHKLKFGQTILDIGPNWHKAKQGTPTMGGFMFIISIIFTFIVVVIVDKIMGGDIVGGGSPIAGEIKVKLYAGLALAFGFGLIGFADDYIKVAKKQNEGLTVIQKTLCQLFLSAGYIITICLTSDSLYMYIPFVGNVEYGNPIIFALFTVIVIYATVNAVNFTDGIDGLCASVTITTAIAFAVISALLHFMGASILACTLAGALAGYLIWNWHPAKCFMGDTGSMFLGGIVVGLSFAINCPLILLLVGFVYVMEGLSDVIQIGYFKITKKIARRTDPNATGKRLFKMAPIHHHFEKCGWSEVKIVLIFSFVNLITGIVACILVHFGQ